MTEENIIRMAREAGLYVEPHRGGNWAVPLVPDLPERVERFATLVAAAERERICQLLGVLPITNDDLRLIRDVIRGEGAK